jgi:hypothetical protein
MEWEGACFHEKNTRQVRDYAKCQKNMELSVVTRSDMKTKK